MNKRIFISHSSKNAEMAMDICQFLEQNGKNCFIAPRDIKQGEAYSESIVKGIDNCDAVILLLSEESNKSPHVLREIERAVSKNKRIFTYRIDNVKTSKALEYFISVNQWVEIKSANDFSKILSSLNDESISEIMSTRNKRKAIFSVVMPFLVIIVVVVLAFILAGKNKKDKIKSNTEIVLENTEQSTEAITEEQAEVVDLKLGDTITFGTYNDEPVEWYVLDIADDKATLVTKYIITMKAFDSAEGGEYAICDGKLFREMSDVDRDKIENQIKAYGSNDYATSNIRTWLNSDKAKVEYKDHAPDKDSMSEHKNYYDSEEGFLYSFTDEEKAVMTTAANGDMVYLLSREEINILFEKAKLRIYTTCTEKAYENDKCHWYNSDYYCVDDKDYYWFTRDAVEGTGNKVYLITNSSDPAHIQTVSAGLEGFGIRPAITLDLTKYSPEA